MLTHFLGSEDQWAIWSYLNGALRDLNGATLAGAVYRQGSETAGVELTGTLTGATGAGVEPGGTPNITYTPATNEFIAGGVITAGTWRLRITTSAGAVVFDAPLQVVAQVT